jgi:hypothetical protein
MGPLMKNGRLQKFSVLCILCIPVLCCLFFLNRYLIISLHLKVERNVVKSPAAPCNCSGWKYSKSSNTLEGNLVGFYNIYAGNDLKLTKRIVDEQVRMLNVSKILEVTRSIRFSVFGFHHDAFIMPEGKGRFAPAGKSREIGDERDTLQILHDHCKHNPGDRVFYIHTKGAFHPSKANDALRQNLMEAVFHCIHARVLDHGDICGLRFAPIPYPHISGVRYNLHMPLI